MAGDFMGFPGSRVNATSLLTLLSAFYGIGTTGYS